jgi:hypothetical protein
MMMNPQMMEMVAEARMADVRMAAAKRSKGRRPARASRTVGIPQIPGMTGTGLQGGARRSIGRFLVRVGMRLALSGQHSVSAA